MIRVASYVHLNRLPNPTGVGKHIDRMVNGLLESQEIDLSLLVSRRQAYSYPPRKFFEGVSYDAFPLPFSLMQRVWMLFDGPPAETWSGPVDWVYCPAESYVPCRNAKLAVTVHDLHAFERNLPWSKSLSHRKFRLKWQFLFKRIVSQADCLITVSEFTKQRLMKLLNVKPELISVVGNGVDDLFFGPAEPPKGEPFETSDYVVVVGGLSFRKGGDFVLEAARALAEQCPEMRIIIVGRSELELSEKANAIGNIVQLGFIRDEYLHQLLSYSLCLLFPSRYEGFGIPVLEAMAAGAPVIVSKSGALPEVVGDAGLYIKSVAEIVANVIQLKDNRRLRDRLVAIGRRRAEDFRWNRCVQRLKAVFLATNMQ